MTDRGPYFYLSFAGTDRWLGGAYVPAWDMVDAVDYSWGHDINPGGEVVGIGPITVDGFPEEYLGVLLSENDLRALGRIMGLPDDDVHTGTAEDMYREFQQMRGDSGGNE